MPVIRKPKIAHSQPLCQLFRLPPAAVVAEIDMHLSLIRIFQECTCIHRLVQKLRRFVVSGDEHVHIRELFSRHIRQVTDDLFRLHAAYHKFKHAQCGNDLRQNQKDSGRGLKYSICPWNCPKHSPDQIDRRKKDRQHKNTVSLLIRLHLSPPSPCPYIGHFYLRRTPSSSGSCMTRRTGLYRRRSSTAASP